jgi:hypothetical protein
MEYARVLVYYLYCHIFEFSVYVYVITCIMNKINTQSLKRYL